MIKNSIYALVIISFLGNWLADRNIIPAQLTVISEIIIFSLFIYSHFYRSVKIDKYSYDKILYFAFFVLCSIISCIVNSWYSIQMLYSLRLILRFYVFYLALINIELKDIDIKRINNFLLFIFLIQLPISAINFYFYGVDEKTHGIHGRGGGLTTIIPLVMIGYLSGYYIFYKKSKKLLVISTLFIVYGIIGAKAALMYIYPLAFLVLYYLAFIKGRNVYLLRHLIIIILLISSSFSVSSLIIKYNPRLNPERKVGGTIDYNYAYWYTKEYTTARDKENPSITHGRYSTSKVALQTMLNESPINLLLGFGPGALTPSIFGYQINHKVKNLSKSYGITGLIYIWTEYGLFGVVIVLIIFIKFLLDGMDWFKYEKDPYYKSFAFGSIFFTVFNILIFITYNKLPIAGDIIPLLFFYCMAVMYLKTRKNRLTTSSKH